MSLKGNLASVNLTEIFQMLSLSGREGTLFIYEGARKRAICFTKDGVSIRSREGNEGNLIGKILVRLGKIDEAVLQQAIEERRESDRLLGDVLVSLGACTREDVELAFRIQSEEDIQELFLNRSDAQFEYVDGYFPESEFPYVNLNVNSLLIEIARRTDEWEYIRRRVRGPREIYRFTGREGTVEADILAECYAHRIDALIDGTRAVGEIIDASYVNKFEVCKLLASYLDAGVIELVPADAIRQNARLALRMGDAESAIRHYEYLMSAGEFPLDVMGEAAEAHEATRDFAEAAALLRRLAEELVRAGDYRGAIDSLRRVANYPRPEPEALNYLMDLVFENPRAAAEFSSNVVEAGKTLVAHHIKHGQRNDALALLGRLLETFPDEVAFAISLVNVHYEDGNVERAVSECERLAHGFLKRRRQSPAVSLFKKLLIIDPERQDVREKIRKIVSGKKRKRHSGGALPRIAVALAVSLLVGGAAVVVLQKEGTATNGGGGMQKRVIDELVARAVNEQAQAKTHGEKAVDGYQQLMKVLADAPLDHLDTVVATLGDAEDSYRHFTGHAERASQLGDTIRTQTPNEETKTRARSMLASIKDLSTKVESTRGLWRTTAQNTADQLYENGRGDYKNAKLSTALKRFELARVLATKRGWAADKNLDRYITNIRSDVTRVRAKLEEAKRREREGEWTEARRIYLDLLKNFGDADLVDSIRLPVEILTVPPEARIELDGVDTGKKTPAFVHLPPREATHVVLRRPGFLDRTFNLGPFAPEETDPAKYTYPEQLFKAATWSVNIRDHIESAPAILRGRVACVGRNGRWYVFSAKTGKEIAAKKLEDTVNGVSAGLVAHEQSFYVPTLDGKLLVFDAISCKERYTVSGLNGGIYATPVVANNVIYTVTYTGWVTARDLRTRKRLWRKKTTNGVRAAPVVQGDDLVVTSFSGEVTVFNRATGDEVIQYKLEGTFSHAPSAAGAEDLVFVTDNGLVRGVERLTGTVRWTHDLRAPPTGPAPVRGRGVFFSTKPRELVAIDTKTGDGIYHSKPSDSSAREVVAGTDRIFFAHGRILTAFAPVRGTEGYGLAWTFRAEGRILAGPVVDPAGEAVYIGDEKGNFYRLEAVDK